MLIGLKLHSRILSGSAATLPRSIAMLLAIKANTRGETAPFAFAPPNRGAGSRQKAYLRDGTREEMGWICGGYTYG